MSKGKSWTHEELVIGMNLYCTMPFGQLHGRNPKIIKLAEKLGRTPGSVAMKLCNFASLDPVHQARGVKGLSGASQADREVWNEFHQNWDGMSFESEVLLAKTEGLPVEKFAGLSEEDLPREGKERERMVKQRVNQCFFRNAVLAAYGRQCCITGLDVPDLLVASHIIPWAKDKSNRVNPRNGVCMNALHDKAFDRGLITITSDYRVELSEKIKKAKECHAKFWLMDFDGAPIRLPERFLPEPEFINWHRANVFKPE